MMKATIMIPAYNAEKFLSETLESALNQTYHEPYEVLVINDGSSDDSGSILEFYNKKYPNLRFLSQENQGIGATRDRLLKDSRGEILFGLDADDILFPQALDKIIRAFDANPKLGFVYTNQQEINEKGKVVGQRIRDDCHRFFYDLIYHCHFPGHLRAFRKESVQDFSFDSNLRTAEDWDFLLKILPFMKIRHLPETLYSYRINQKGISIGTGDETIGVSIDLLKKYIKERNLYDGRNFEVIPVDAGNHIIYYDHYINGSSVMNPKAKETLERYLRKGF